MTQDREQKYVSWTWIVSILISILLIGLSAFVADMNGRLNGKVDRREFDLFIAQSKETWCSIDNKLTTIINMHLDQRGVKIK
jgi:hypothetical protein